MYGIQAVDLFNFYEYIYYKYRCCDFIYIKKEIYWNSNFFPRYFFSFINSVYYFHFGYRRVTDKLLQKDYLTRLVTRYVGGENAYNLSVTK